MAYAIGVCEQRAKLEQQPKSTKREAQITRNTLLIRISSASTQVLFSILTMSIVLINTVAIAVATTIIIIIIIIVITVIIIVIVTTAMPGP